MDMGDDLLPKVDLYRLSGPAQEVIKDIMREVLAEQGGPSVPVGALRAPDAAAYVSVSRSKFYLLLKTDAELQAIAIPMGDYRVWRPSDLDRWLQDRRARLAPPNVERAA
jgi:predicted DNA-binding transcriptional regulator AlpA